MVKVAGAFFLLIHIYTYYNLQEVSQYLIKRFKLSIQRILSLLLLLLLLL